MNITPLIRIIRSLDYLAGYIIGLCTYHLVKQPQHIYQVYVIAGGNIFGGKTTNLPEHVYTSEEHAQYVCVVLTAQSYQSRVGDIYLYHRLTVRNRPNLSVIRIAQPNER